MILFPFHLVELAAALMEVLVLVTCNAQVFIHPAYSHCAVKPPVVPKMFLPTMIIISIELRYLLFSISFPSWFDICWEYVL